MLITQRETQLLPAFLSQEDRRGQTSSRICIFFKDWAKGNRAQVKQGRCRLDTRRNFLTLETDYKLFEGIVRSVPPS